jgi:hypothetical protein
MAARARQGCRLKDVQEPATNQVRAPCEKGPHVSATRQPDARRDRDRGSVAGRGWLMNARVGALMLEVRACK